MPTLAEPRRPGRPRDPEAGRAILEATMTELAEHGFSGLTIEGVASRSGTSKATIYRRWAGKEALVLDAASQLVPAAKLPDTGNLRDDLVEAFADVYLDVVKPYADCMAALIAEAMVNEDVRKLIAEFSRSRRAASRTLVERGIDRGELPRGADADVLLELVSGALLYHRVLGGQDVDRAHVERVVDVALAGVRHH